MRKASKRATSLLLLALSVEVAMPALAAHAAQGADKACAPSLAMNEKETETYYMFNARLSWLGDHYGKPTFEAKLASILENGWPRKRMIEVSPAYYERLQNLVEQQRLKDSIARSIGLGDPAWVSYEGLMRTITLHQGTGNDLTNPFEKSAVALMKAIDATPIPGSPGKAGDPIRAEAIVRVANMHAYLTKWRALNGELIDERADASAKTVALTAIGLVGAGVLVSTLVVSGPVVSAAGAYAATIPATPFWSALLVKTFEAAAGAGIGLYGAPGAKMLEDSFETISEAGKQAANKGTKLPCELDKQSDHWRSVAADHLLSASLKGGVMGIGGGALTFTGASAKAVLYFTAGAVGVAQAYSIGKMGWKGVQAVQAFKDAESLEAAGKHDDAVAMLKKARDLAQEEKASALEAIIIGTLSYHITAHFKHALHEGQAAIRQLYAASADTVPTAYKAGTDMVSSVAAGASHGGGSKH